MAAKTIRQTKFSSGEVDITTWKRTDVEEYLTAAQSLLNMEVGTTLLAKKCKGTLFQGNVTSYVDPNSNIYEFIDENFNFYLVMTANTKIEIFKTNPLAHYQTITGTPYLSSDLDSIDTDQDNDILIMSHIKYPPARLYISTYPTPTTPTFAYQVLNIQPFPSYDFSEVQYNNYAVTYAISGNTLIFTITAPSGPTGFTTDWIGGQIIGEGNNVSQPLGYANIIGITNTGSQTVFDATIQVPFLASGFPVVGSQYSIRQPAWSATLGWPAKVLFYQNRLWLAATLKQPTGIFGSAINAPINYDVGLGTDIDAIVYAISGKIGSILWLNGGKQLEIYTSNLEFVCPQDQNAALTPGTFAVRQQSAFGCSSIVKPIAYLNDSYFITKTGKSIVNFSFDGVGLSYSAKNVSVQSSHLVKNPTARALVRGDSTSQDNFIYYLNPDYTLTTFQFAHEEKLAALTPRDFNSDTANPVTIIDIETIQNQVYILKKLNLNGNYIIEIMDDNYRQDSSQVLTLPESGIISGLTDFIGYKVGVYYAGQDFGTYVVDNAGQITVNNPPQLLGQVATVGMYYNCNITPMYIFAGNPGSNYFKDISRIFVDYINTVNFQIGGVQVPYLFYTNQNNVGLTLVPQTGTAEVNLTLGWDQFQTFTISQYGPFDLQITGIAYEVDAQII